METAPVTAGDDMVPVTVGGDRHAPGQGAASVARCESCGAPSADGDLCRACQQAFAPLLGITMLTAPSDDSMTASAKVAVAPFEITRSAEFMSSSSPSNAPDAASSAEAALPPLTPASNGELETAKVDTVRTEAAKAESARAVAASVVAARVAAASAAAAKSERVDPAKALKPPVVSKLPIVSVPSPRRTRSIVLAVAALGIFAVIGVPQGARWLGIAREEPSAQPTPVAEGVTVAEHLATPSDARSAAKAASKGRESTTASPQAAASTRAKPTGRQPNPSTPKVVPVSTPNPATEAPARTAAPPPPARVAAEPRRSVAPAAPIGKFFEPRDVDQSPQIATRVEPQLPAALRARPLNDIVVVRVLVSQTGHPFRIGLLRGSRVGRSLDDAVVAAVTQWTFSPAMKRGEAVSCWYNIGVPLGRAN